MEILVIVLWNVDYIRPRGIIVARTLMSRGLVVAKFGDSRSLDRALQY